MRVFIPKRIVLLFLAGFLPFSLAKDFGVSVGLKSQTANVIDNDNILEGYKDGSAIVGSSVQFSKFYYFTSSEDIWLNKPTVVSSETDCSPDLEDWDVNESAMKVLGEEEEKYFIIKYDCLAGGEVTITMPLTFSRKSSDNEHKVFQLEYKYICPDIERDVGNVVTGFNIGTQPNSYDCVKDGLTHPQFSVKADEDTTTLYTVDDNTDSITFHFWASRTLNVEHPEVDVENRTIVQVVPLGWPMNPSSIIERGYPRKLTFLFRCLTKGKTIVSVATSAGVDMNAEGDSTQEVVFSFEKLCPGLHDVQGAGIFGLTVGTKKRRTDVVEDGITKKMYQIAANKADQAKHKRLEVSASEKTKTFYLELNSDTTQEFDKPLVIARSPSGERITRPELSGSLMSEHVLDKNTKEITVKFYCYNQGSTEVTVIIPVPPSGSIGFTFVKKCPMQNYQDIIENEEREEHEGAVPKFLSGFNVGTKNDKENEKNVISSAIPVGQYHWGKDEGDLRLVKTSRHYLHFYISVDTDVNSAPIGFDPPVISSNLAVCNPVITNHASLGGEFSSDGIFTRKDRLKKKSKKRLATKKPLM